MNKTPPWRQRRSVQARGLYLSAPPMHAPVGEAEPGAEYVCGACGHHVCSCEKAPATLADLFPLTGAKMRLESTPSAGLGHEYDDADAPWREYSRTMMPKPRGPLDAQAIREVFESVLQGRETVLCVDRCSEKDGYSVDVAVRPGYILRTDVTAREAALGEREVRFIAEESLDVCRRSQSEEQEKGTARLDRSRGASATFVNMDEAKCARSLTIEEIRQIARGAMAEFVGPVAVVAEYAETCQFYRVTFMREFEGHELVTSVGVSANTSEEGARALFLRVARESLFIREAEAKAKEGGYG